MIIDYDHNPNITDERRLQSLKESVQMALNDVESKAASVSSILADVKKSLTKVLNVLPARLGDIVQIKDVYLGSFSIAGNGVLSINLYNTCVSAAPSGYSFVGIAGFSTNHGSIVMISARPIDSIYSFECRNLSSSAFTIQPHVWAMYTRNA